VVQGRDELGNVLDQLSRGPEMDERLAGRLIELLTCVSASGLVPRADVVSPIAFHDFPLEKKKKNYLPSHFWHYIVARHAGLTFFFNKFSHPNFLLSVPARRSRLLENARS
jgi:hypothetical protein